MESQQIEYMLKNGISESDCNSCSKSIVGTLKPHEKHLVICNGNSSYWKSHIDQHGESPLDDLVSNFRILSTQRCCRCIHFNTTGVPQKLSQALDEYNKEALKPVSIVITATDYDSYPSHENEVSDEREVDARKTVQIISYPSADIYSVLPNVDFKQFLKEVIHREGKHTSSSGSSSSTSIPDYNDDSAVLKGQLDGAGDGTDKNSNIDPSVESGGIDNNVAESTEIRESSEAISTISFVSKVPWKNLILVCIHASRDNRCGRAGPQIIDEINSQLELRKIPLGEIVVSGSSHIGGHKYAGVLIVYPQGDWYGLISKRSVSDLLDCVISNTKYLKGWRGNESTDW